MKATTRPSGESAVPSPVGEVGQLLIRRRRHEPTARIDQAHDRQREGEQRERADRPTGVAHPEAINRHRRRLIACAKKLREEAARGRIAESQGRNVPSPAR